MGNKERRAGELVYFFLVCIITTPILICGCSHFNAESASKKPMIFSAMEITMPL